MAEVNKPPLTFDPEDSRLLPAPVKQSRSLGNLEIG